MVLNRRLGDIQPGHERSFLFATALRVAAEWRRRTATRSECAEAESDEERADPGPLPDEQLDAALARRLLDEIMAAIPVELASVLALYEFEELTAKQIAELIGTPAGTVASRLRRARELFDARVLRVKARRQGKGLNR